MIMLLEGIDDIKLKNILKGNIITHENIDEAFDMYTHGFLDNFDHCLNEKETKYLLSSFLEHNLKHEYKFIEFFKLAYKLNENEPIIMNLPFHEIDSTHLLNMLNKLDYVDKILFI